MSFRKRARPMLSASAVANSRSKPNDKPDKKPLCDEKLDVNTCPISDAKLPDSIQSEVSAKENGSTGSTIEDAPIKQDAVKQNEPTANPPQTTVKPILSKRFTRVRPSPILNPRKSKVEKKYITEGEKLDTDSSQLTSNKSAGCAVDVEGSSSELIKTPDQSTELPLNTDQNVLSFMVTCKEISNIEVPTSEENSNPISLDYSPTKDKDPNLILECSDQVDNINQEKVSDVTSSSSELKSLKDVSDTQTEAKTTEDTASGGLLLKGRFKKSRNVPNLAVPRVKKDSLACEQVNKTDSNEGQTEKDTEEKPEVSSGNGNPKSMGRLKRTKMLPNIINKRSKSVSKNPDSVPDKPAYVESETSCLGKAETIDEGRAFEKDIVDKTDITDTGTNYTSVSNEHLKTVDDNCMEISSASLVTSCNTNNENVNEKEECSRKRSRTENSEDFSEAGKSDNMDLHDKKEKNDSVLSTNITTAETTNTKLESAEKQQATYRKPKRARFKPNVKPKEKQSDSNNKNANSDSNSKVADAVLDCSDTQLSVGKEQNKEEIEEKATQNNEKEKKDEKSKGQPKKRVRFTPNLMKQNARKNSKSETSPKTDTPEEEIEDLSAKTNSNVVADSTKGNETSSPFALKSHSDGDDGSQSESEGLHHHNKRTFAPCLGPKVRQRRRLSSMTLSEDEGTIADMKSTDKSDDGTKNSKLIVDADENCQASKDSTEEKSEGKKKKTKRSRIVIKEPKEKMTMFDFIYYNPQSSEQEKTAKEEDKKGRRRQDEVMLPQETETIVETLGAKKEKKEGLGPSVGGDTGGLGEEGGDDSVIAPQIKIGEDGNIIIDQESLLLKTTRSHLSLEGSQIVYDDGDSFNPYRRRKDPGNKKKRWPLQETLKFYRALSRVGTDFGLMAQFFPDCTRRNLKQKFKTEEKFNLDLIDRALKNMLPMDEALFSELDKGKKGIINADEKEIIAAEAQSMEVAENVTI